MVKWCLGLAAAGPVTAPLFAQIAPFPILLQGRASGQETRETSSMAALGNWDSAGGSAPRMRQETIASSWPFMAPALYFPVIFLPSVPQPVLVDGEKEGSLVSSALGSSWHSSRYWESGSVGFGSWAHVPVSLLTLPANVPGQAREWLLHPWAPSLGWNSWCQRKGLVFPGQVLGVQVMFSIRRGLWRRGGQLPLSNLSMSGQLKLDDF